MKVFFSYRFDPGIRRSHDPLYMAGDERLSALTDLTRLVATGRGLSSLAATVRGGFTPPVIQGGGSYG